MAKITLLNPLDQPTGRTRVIDILKGSLQELDFHEFRMGIAFAKLAPLVKLHSEIQGFKARGGKIRAIWGIDHRGTSIQALLYGIRTFDELRVLHMRQRVTFHPKMYYFSGDVKARLIMGSHNLTIGGTESNFEAGAILDLDVSDDATLMQSISISLNELEEHTIKFGYRELVRSKKSGLLLDESESQSSDLSASPLSGQNIFPSTSQSLSIKPPSPLPIVTIRRPIKKSAHQYAYIILPATQFVIQINPHHNGEVFLSKIAVTQNPAFFGFPFTGRTTPKKSSNIAYPQRDPDPKVNINVWAAGVSPVARVTNYDLNTVYYAPKSEIRITIPANILQATTDFSILLMKIASRGSGLDYEMDIYTQSSPSYSVYLACCNQTLPSGGNPIARKMGWL